MIRRLSRTSAVYCSDSIQIATGPDRVWAVLTDVESWPDWNYKIAYAFLNTTVETDQRFVWKVNGAVIKSVFQEVEACKVLNWRGVTLGAWAVHQWRLDYRNGVTNVEVEESMDGWMVRLFRKKMNKDLRNDMRHWLQALKIRSEIKSPK